ncbi:MAG: DUF2249 domain-containing protein [Candidatus Nanopelagicales bacterium]|mgnify:FL=1
MVQQIPLAGSGGACNCGAHDQADPVLDARVIPHAVRHAAIFGALDSIAPGSAMVLVAPHDPIPLLSQAADRYGDAMSVDYLQRGPDDWQLRFERTS